MAGDKKQPLRRRLSALEVSRYRDDILDDFNRICAENNYHGIV